MSGPCHQNNGQVSHLLGLAPMEVHQRLEAQAGSWSAPVSGMSEPYYHGKNYRGSMES